MKEESSSAILFGQALALHQQGQLMAAEPLYLQVLQLQPDHAGALHLLGVIHLQRAQFAQGEALIAQALRLQPDVAVFHGNHAGALRSLGRLHEAVQCYERAIGLDPRYWDAYVNLGDLFQLLNQFDKAVASYKRVVEFMPEHLVAHRQLANLLTALGRHQEALASYEQLVLRDPGNAQAHYACAHSLLLLKRFAEAVACVDRAIALNPAWAQAHALRGAALHQIKQFELALACYEKTLALDPEDAEVYSNRGDALRALRRFDLALASCTRALALKPDFAEAHNNLGNVLFELKQFSEAIASYEQGIALQPAYVEAHCNRGNALKELGRFEEAVTGYDKAIALKPDYAQAYSGRGNALKELRQFAAAQLSFDQAIFYDPESAQARFNKSLLLLSLGRFAEAWPLYEWRFQENILGSVRREYTAPLWRGETLRAGERIFLWPEQGLGDTLQFGRYVRALAARGVEVILEVQEPLYPLFKGMAGVSQLLRKGDPLPDFDWHCPLLSLPLAFATTLDNIPAAAYLASKAEKRMQWEHRLGPARGLRVGLVWSGNPRQKEDHHRSLALAELMSALPPGFDYVCLQKELRARDRQALAESGVRFFGEHLHDFSDTAALCDLMDVVISSCTSVAHLSGGLGKATWMLLHAGADWRWLLDREDSPWYPTARLYRQPAIGDWASVLARVHADLHLLKALLPGSGQAEKKLRITAVDLKNEAISSAWLALLDHYARDPMGGGGGLSDYAKANLAGELAGLPTFHGAMAFIGDEAVGLINCFLGFSTFAAKPLLNIHDIVTRDGWRGQGIGQALLGWAEQRAREIGCCKLTLEVLSNNTRALASYERAGFAPYVLDPRAGQALFLQKYLTQEFA